MKLFGIALLAYILFPTHHVHAIPPPELITSVSQSILHLLGIITAFVILGISSLRVFWSQLFLEKKYKVAFYVVVFIVCTVTCFLLYQYHLNAKKQSYIATSSAELEAIWSEYDKIYTAPRESIANQSLTDTDNAVSWREFKTLSSTTPYLVIDIRDKKPFEAGHIPGSIHMRFTDLIKGDWQNIDVAKDTPIFLVCYQGTTGALASSFLTARGFEQVYRPKDGLLKNRNALIGGSVFLPRNETQHLYQDNLNEALARENHIIDLRTTGVESAYDTVFRDQLTTPEIESYITSLPTDAHYTLLCNSELSCYSADMFFYDFEEHGLTLHSIVDTR